MEDEMKSVCGIGDIRPSGGGKFYVVSGAKHEKLVPYRAFPLTDGSVACLERPRGYTVEAVDKLDPRMVKFLR